jgi:hypothetical protein
LGGCIVPISFLKSVYVGIKASFTGSTSILYLGTGNWTSSLTCGQNTPINYDWYLRKEGQVKQLIPNTNIPNLTLVSVKAATTLTKMFDSKQPTTYTIFYLSLAVTDNQGDRYETSEMQIFAYGTVDLVPTEINPYTIEKEFIIYPNPAKSDFLVEYAGSSFSDKFTVQLYSPNNRLIYSGESIQESMKITVSNLKPGIYIVKITYNNKNYSDQIIIQ